MIDILLDTVNYKHSQLQDIQIDETVMNGFMDETTSVNSKLYAFSASRHPVRLSSTPLQEISPSFH